MDSELYLLKMTITKFPEALLHTYPFSLGFVHPGLSLTFIKPITIFVGENGCGKSTILEIIASHMGFNPAGGNRNHIYSSTTDDLALFEHFVVFSWKKKIGTGFFFRAESFFDFARYVDSDKDISEGYGLKFGNVSHGQSFLAMLKRLPKGIIILDEPEAALSPQSQLQLIAILSEKTKGGSQVFLATHSPILLTIPNSCIIQFDDQALKIINYSETELFQFYKDYISSPERYLKYLLDPDIDEEQDK